MARFDFEKGGSWKKRSKPEGKNSRVPSGGVLEQAENRCCTISKRKFYLVDKAESLDFLVQDGKKYRKGPEDVNMVEILVKEASYKWPRVD